MRFNNTKIICSALFLVSILLSACSGGGSSGASSTPATTPQTTSTLSGVAAVGTPIVTGTINISCAAGSALAPTTTSNMGAWQVTLSGQTLPCAVQVTGGTINGVANTMLYHSIAIAPGTVNVTPFTDLMVANLAGTATPSIWFTGLSTTPTPLTAITQTQVDAALAKLRIALSGLTQLSTINPITTAFTPTTGNVSDDMLTAMKTAMTNTGVTYMSLLGNASIPAFTAPVTGFGTAMMTAYTGIANGTTTGGTASTAGPGITGVLPTSAAPGTAVTISGTNFAAGTTLLSGSNYRVSFNGTTVTPSARTLTQLAVIVPTGATTGTLTVTDLTTNQVYAVSGGFTVTGTTGGGTGTTVAVGTQMGGARQGSLLNLTGVVTTFAGPSNAMCTANGGNCPIGSNDAVGKNAMFRGNWGITSDGTNLYVADNNGNTIRKVVIATGQVSTLAGTANVIGGFLDGTGATAQLNLPTGLTTDGTNVFVADSGNNNIRKVVIATGQVTTLAGPNNAACQNASPPSICPSGTNDGIGAAARFNKPAGLTTDGTNLYVADMANNTIRKIVIATGNVTTIAGTTGAPFGGYADGTGIGATFFKPYGLITDGTNLYVADTGNYTIRKIVIATAQVTTIAGTPGLFGTADGVGTTARFNNPFYITMDGTNLFVGDNSNYTIRQIVISTGLVSTLAGKPGAYGFTDGTGSAARFSGMYGFGITTDGTSLYLADTTNNTIRKIQ